MTGEELLPLSGSDVDDEASRDGRDCILVAFTPRCTASMSASALPILTQNEWEQSNIKALLTYLELQQRPPCVARMQMIAT